LQTIAMCWRDITWIGETGTNGFFTPKLVMMIDDISLSDAQG
jgi:hypothetical protein